MVSGAMGTLLMITRRSFIAAMKKNGFTYSPRTRLLHRDGFDGNPAIEVIMYIKVATAHENKEYVEFWLQKKFGYDHETADEVALFRTYDLIPFEHVMLQLSLIKDMRRWWLA
jgi:hypothetical protein